MLVHHVTGDNLQRVAGDARGDEGAPTLAQGSDGVDGKLATLYQFLQNPERLPTLYRAVVLTHDRQLLVV